MMYHDIHLYQFKVMICGTLPSVWRRILVSSTETLYEFHKILQLVMGWKGIHQHGFILGRQGSDVFVTESIENSRFERLITLQGLIQKGYKTFIYLYDFNDEWEHEISLETSIVMDKWLPVPVCLAGRMACPPEDCGGLRGYHYLTDDSEYCNMVTWLGCPFDKELFDLREVNEKLMEYRISDQTDADSIFDRIPLGHPATTGRLTRRNEMLIQDNI